MELKYGPNTTLNVFLLQRTYPSLGKYFIDAEGRVYSMKGKTVYKMYGSGSRSSLL